MMKCRYETIASKRCWGTKEIDPCPGYDKCKDYRPDCTNADRIRSMTDDQLAENNVRKTFMKASGRYSFGESYTDYLPAWGTSDGWQFLSEKEAKAHELEWLQRPAEECE